MQSKEIYFNKIILRFLIKFNLVMYIIDSENHMVYISSPSTPNQDLFKDIRNSCVRSLNVEVCYPVQRSLLYKT
jgi:hypothetical protein